MHWENTHFPDRILHQIQFLDSADALQRFSAARGFWEKKIGKRSRMISGVNRTFVDSVSCPANGIRFTLDNSNIIYLSTDAFVYAGVFKRCLNLVRCHHAKTSPNDDFQTDVLIFASKVPFSTFLPFALLISNCFPFAAGHCAFLIRFELALLQLIFIVTLHPWTVICNKDPRRDSSIIEFPVRRQSKLHLHRTKI